MATGNKGFAKGLAGAGGGASTHIPARLPPRTGILDARDNRLAELASGRMVTRMQELVDPSRCRIWAGHNRDYAALNAETCADLIESFKAQGRQEVPAIVRRISDDANYQYEVICGARRHWTVAWLRAHDHPEFRFLVEPRELTDEEAFRLADLENRSRRDLSDYERAADYARALERYYEGSQQRMAERLEVGRSWLSRYLELAKLPAEILTAFGSPHVVRISHGAVLAPLLRLPPQRERMITAAREVGMQQADHAARGVAPLPPAIVLRRLTAAAKAPRGSRATGECIIRAPDGSIVARGQRVGRGGGVTVTIPTPGKFGHDGVLDAVGAILEQLRASTG